MKTLRHLTDPGAFISHPSLSADDVLPLRQHARNVDTEARELHQRANQLSNPALAEKFGVTRDTISAAVNYRHWRHIKE